MIYLLRNSTPGREQAGLAPPVLFISVASSIPIISYHQFLHFFQDLFHRLHPIHFFNTRSLGVGISRNTSAYSLASHKDVILGFSAGLRRGSAGTMDFNSSESNTVMHFVEMENEIIEETIEYAQDISLWIAGEICGMASVKVGVFIYVMTAGTCFTLENMF